MSPQMSMATGHIKPGGVLHSAWFPFFLAADCRPTFSAPLSRFAFRVFGGGFGGVPGGGFFDLFAQGLGAF